MTNTQLQDIFNDNISVFSFPIYAEKGNDVFPTLYKKLDDFLNVLKNTPGLTCCVETVKKEIELIKGIVSDYYSGKIELALQKVQNIIYDISSACPHAITDLDDMFIDDESKQWYRARQSNRQLLSKQGLKHVPASKRGIIPNYRYSINGIPCLYIANSIYTCWEELDRPPLDDLWVSRYSPKQKIKVLNISTTPNEIIDPSRFIKNYKEDDETGYTNLVKEYMYCFALQCACSIVVKEDNRIFREEYVIPQLLMMKIKMNNIDGIMYFSTKFSVASLNDGSWISKNLAIPAFDLVDKDYSEYIEQHFAISEPINIGLYSTGAIVARRVIYPIQDNWARTHANIFVNNIWSQYSDTIFYKCELELCQDYYRLNE